jgi:hypothetical protein
MPFTELSCPDRLSLSLLRASTTVIDIAVTSIVRYELVFALYESNICAAHDNDESVSDPRGSRELTKLTSDWAWSDMNVPKEGEMNPNWYVNGRSESTQLFAYSVNVSVTASPVKGFTIKLPGLGGEFTETVIDANDESPVTSVAVK